MCKRGESFSISCVHLNSPHIFALGQFLLGSPLENIMNDFLKELLCSVYNMFVQVGSITHVSSDFYDWMSSSSDTIRRRISIEKTIRSVIFYAPKLRCLIIFTFTATAALYVLPAFKIGFGS